MLLLVIAGIAAVVAGAVAIWFGIPVKEFSFGNTMILAGAVAICNGLLLIGLGFVIRELKAVRLSLRERPLEAFDRETEGHLLPAGSIARRRSRDEFGVRHVASEGLVPTAPRRQASRSDDGGSSAQDAEPSGIERGKLAPEVVQPVAPPAKARHNLLFSSSRKERGGEELAAEPPVGAPAAEPVIAADTRGASQPHPSFDNTWPRTERPSRAEPTTSRRDATLAPPSRSDRASASEQGASTATVVKSGSVDGMAYSLYSDGSIEAQMPEGMMRFASIEKLRAHLDRST